MQQVLGRRGQCYYRKVLLSLSISPAVTFFFKWKVKHLQFPAPALYFFVSAPPLPMQTPLPFLGSSSSVSPTTSATTAPTLSHRTPTTLQHLSAAGQHHASRFLSVLHAAFHYESPSCNLKQSSFLKFTLSILTVYLHYSLMWKPYLPQT